MSWLTFVLLALVLIFAVQGFRKGMLRMAISMAVSYTHLDVYKRQVQRFSGTGNLCSGGYGDRRQDGQCRLSCIHAVR